MVIKMKRTKKATKGEAVFLLVAGLIIGTVFTFGVKYWNAPITEDEAQLVTATFSSYKNSRNRRGNIREIIIRFTDHKQLYIDGSCIDDDLCDTINDIETGAVIELKVHPNSDTIVEMKVGKIQLLEFQDSIQKLSFEASGFTYLGIFCYIMALIGIIELFWQRKR